MTVQLLSNMQLMRSGCLQLPLKSHNIHCETSDRIGQIYYYFKSCYRSG